MQEGQKLFRVDSRGPNLLPSSEEIHLGNWCCPNLFYEISY